jgi:tryptophan synthase alpha chain
LESSRTVRRRALRGRSRLITPDLIPDEAFEWQEAAEKYGLDRVYLAAPTSTPARVASACAASQGFVYAVSTMGITGARNELDANARAVTEAIRSADPDAFACVGIGISTAAQVQEVNTYADGAIVGSAFVNAYLHAGLPALVAKVKELAGRV